MAISVNSQHIDFIKKSFHLISSQVSLAVSGLFFWWLAVRLYPVEAIGVASALFSLAALFIFVASLGITPTLIRFLPRVRDTPALFSTFISFSLLTLFFSYLIFIPLARFLPKLEIYGNFFYIFAVFSGILIMHLHQLGDSIFLPFRLTGLALCKNIIQNFLRIPLLFICPYLGAFNIFGANCIASALASGLALWYFAKRHKLGLSLRINLKQLKTLLPFSFINFLNAAPLRLPLVLFPLVAISFFSKKDAGFFYIPLMIFAVYCSFILSAANVFLMQACNKGNIKILLKQLVLSVFSLSAIGFAIFYFFADKILLFFGREFQKCCAPVLRILFMSIFSFAINQVYFGVLNLYNNIRQMAIISIAMLLAMAIALVVFLPALGVLAIAYAWVIANIIGNFCVILMNKRFIGITAAGDVCLLD